MSAHKLTVESETFLFKYAHFDFHAGFTQHCDATSGNLGKGVGTPHNNAGNPLADDKFRTGRSFAIVGTRLKSDIHRGIPEQGLIAYRSDSIDLSMTLTAATVPPLPYYPTVRSHYHGSYHRIRGSIENTVACKLNSTPHIFLIEGLSNRHFPL